MEGWRPVVGWEEAYEVSESGRVRSLTRQVVTSSGQNRIKRGRELAGFVSAAGYKFVTLYAFGQSKRCPVHRLVAQAFLPNPSNLPWVLHWDDDPWNNHVSNLRWGTPRDNTRDSVRNGSHGKASRTHCPAGHEFTTENTYIRNNGARRCRTCTLEQNKRYQEKKEKTLQWR